MPNGMDWTVRLLRIASGCHFHVGWPQFRADNQLQHGDILTFTLVDVGKFHVKRYKTRSGCPPRSDLELYPEDYEDEGIYSPDVDTSDDYVPSDHDSDSTDGEDFVEDRGVLDDDGYPMFTVELTRTHIRRTLDIPYGFWQSYISMSALDGHVYFNVDGETWRMLLGHSPRKIWVQQGWRRFKRDNRLRAGVRCHFKLIDAHDVQFYVWFERD